MLTDGGHLTPGWIAGIIVTVILALAMVASWTWWIRWNHEGRTEQWMGIMIPVFITGFLTLPIIANWPWQPSFHKYYAVAGTVQTITYRPYDTRYAIVFAESGKTFGCDDTRCSTLKTGDEVHLKCKREWQYQSVSGWGCRWDQP